MNQLLDVLSVVIAFATLMLLLSLVVTSLVQSAQYVFQMRIRTLQRGLEDLLGTSLASAETDGGARQAGEEHAEKASKLARDILTSPYVSQGRIGRRTTAGGRWLGRLASMRRTSWIEKDELKALLRQQSGELGAASVKVLRDVDRWFERLEANTQKEFLVRVRWVTLALALGVAAVFQVDAFETLRELSMNPELRQELSAAASPLLEETKAEIADLRDQRRVAEEALLRLDRANDDPAIQTAIEEVAGSDSDRGEQVDELRLALEAHDVPAETRDQQIARYRSHLEEIAGERLDRAEAMRTAAVGQLARFNVTPWGRTGEFYWRKGHGLRGLQLGHLLGVLVTAAFLSLGAPFWFNQLKNLAALRDQLEQALGKKKA